ncbi:MAG: hypothetical protein KBC88_05980 [Alphaproteobacteria bacterium]|jgi:hypothetical protein|nr:hypothetical protein [Alphaproteobacteria bacterium]
MKKANIILVMLTVSAFGFLTAWTPCILTFCKTISIPEWLEVVYFATPIPFFGNFLIAGVFVLPISFLSQDWKACAWVGTVSPAVISLVKYIPQFDPKYDYYNLLFDYIFSLIPICVTLSFFMLVPKLSKFTWLLLLKHFRPVPSNSKES